jgi:light-regulated signal transduction histidine kinase (bacteriophytochrome)
MRELGPLRDALHDRADLARDGVQAPLRSGGIAALVGAGAAWLLWQRTHNEWVLGTGLLASAVAAGAVAFVERARSRTRAQDEARARLEARLVAAQAEEQQLRKQVELLEARVRERTAQLEDAILEFETFNYSVSHDLRSPLGAIINLTAILEEDQLALLDDTGRDCLRRIIGSATAALALTDGILAFSRSGRRETRIELVRMQALCEDVAAELAAARPESDCSFRIGALPDVEADPELMRIVVANLLGNACKFVAKGSHPAVEVGGASTAHEVVYFVRDGGIGFDMKYADRLFRPFERIHGDPQYAGHGLGLAIVARIVRRHGGRVWAESQPGLGATFSFALPKRVHDDV